MSGLYSVSCQHLIDHPVGAGGCLTCAGTMPQTVQVIYYGLDEGLLDVLRVWDRKFAGALVGGQQDG